MHNCIRRTKYPKLKNIVDFITKSKKQSKASEDLLKFVYVTDRAWWKICKKIGSFFKRKPKINELTPTFTTFTMPRFKNPKPFPALFADDIMSVTPMSTPYKPKK